jgi:tripartite-type tricarboxylate transporter receptor subunit TctC
MFRPSPAALATLLLCTLLAPIVGAQDNWPVKPVRVIVTFPPGGSSDIAARLIAPVLQERLGQPVVIDNRPGAGGSIGADAVAKSAADGYTLMLSNTTPISITPFMLAASPYDPVKSFTHAFFIGQVPNVFVVHPLVPAKNFAEYLAWMKQQTKPVNYGSGGVGSIGHIVGELFKTELNLKMEHVPYKGSSPMHADLLANTIPMAVDSLPQNLPFMKEGKLRLLAVTSRTRMSMAPDLPTVVELGYPKLVAENFLGLSGPAGLSTSIVTRLHAAMTEVMKNPTIRNRLDELGISSRPMSSVEFAEFVRQQVTDWAPAVKASGAKLN